MACKPTDDKQGNHSPEGVITMLKTNDGNELHVLIMPPPQGSQWAAHSTHNSYRVSLTLFTVRFNEMCTNVQFSWCQERKCGTKQRKHWMAGPSVFKRYTATLSTRAPCSMQYCSIQNGERASSLQIPWMLSQSLPAWATEWITLAKWAVCDRNALSSHSKLHLRHPYCHRGQPFRLE